MSRDRWLQRWRIYAPPPFSWQLAVIYAAFIVPAVLGAVLGWPWGITMALLFPALVAHITLGIRTAQVRGIRWLPPMRYRLALGLIVGIFVGLVNAALYPRHIYPLVLVAFVMLVLDPLDRVARRRYLH